MSDKSEERAGRDSSGDKRKIEFWKTLPGILTGVAGVITAVGALIVALSQTELLQGKQGNDTNFPTDSSQESIQPDSVAIIQTSGSFPVYAHRSSEFINPSQETKTILFKASGQWLAVPETEPPPNGYVSPQGYVNKRCNENCWCPQYVVGALVGSKHQDCFEIGTEGAITLAGGQGLLLYMNDFQDSSDDNLGDIIIEWSIVE